MVEWSEDSISSMQSIYDYIFEISPQNAELVVDTLFDLGEKLNIFPEKKRLTLHSHWSDKPPSALYLVKKRTTTAATATLHV